MTVLLMLTFLSTRCHLDQIFVKVFAKRLSEEEKDRERDKNAFDVNKDREREVEI